jgi:diguanylate cyclase (GGDEF)-like protein
MSETTDIVPYPTTLPPGAWQRVEATVGAALPAEQAAALLDDLRQALVSDAGEPDWDDLASENARLEQEIEVAASVDPLTGLRNRTRFLEDLRREFATARRYETPLSLIVLDVDGLRDVNAQQGFEAGDRLLLVLSELLLTRLRISDIAARIGDDDFAVILPQTPLKGARALSERILDTLGDWLHAGASTLTADVTSGADLLQRADRDLVAQRAERAAQSTSG